MSEHAVAQPQKANAPQVMTRCTDALQRWATNQIDPAALPERLFDAGSGTFAEPRFRYDFSRMRLHANETLPLLRAPPMVQRVPSNGAAASMPDVVRAEQETAPTPAEPVTEPETADEPAAPGLLVEDSATELVPGQMRKSEFLEQLRTSVCAATEPILARTGRTTEGCPYFDYWFDYYGQRDAQHSERALQRYAPQAASATTARDYIPIVAERVRQGVETWAQTGEVSGVPEGVPTTVPEETPPPEGSEATGPVLFKARDGGPRPSGDPRAVRAQLGDGRPLDSGVRSRMETAFGASFGHVRMHTDSNAAGLSSNLNARAFTVGKHVAFGASEYQPGTLLGDALIAHELAHVVQQGGRSSSVAPMKTGDASYNALEKDADKSAVGVVTSLWSGAKGILIDIAQNALPRLRSGLRLSRCENRSGKELKVSILPVHISEDDGKNPTTLPSFTKTQEIWKKCCIDVSVKSATTVAKTAYQELDVGWPKTTEMNTLASKVSKGDSIPVFIPKTFVKGGSKSKDHLGGAIGPYPPDSEVFAVEGIHPTIVAHELGHAMGYVGHKPGTVMEPSGKHNKPAPEAVDKTVCSSVRKFSNAKVKSKNCAVSAK